MFFFIFFLINFLMLLIPLLISVAFLTLLERKVMSTIQRRVGPNVVGVFGLLQPFADGFKIVFKDTIFPRNILVLPFIMGPMFLFTFSFIAIGFIPLNFGVALFYHPFSMIFILVFLGFAIYGVVAAGWASNSKYAMLGCLRALSQMIAYEICLSTSLSCLMFICGSLDLQEIVLFQTKYFWFFVPCFPCFILVFISALAETYRVPFDLPEAEGEIVAGVHVEYSAILFALFYLAEYASLIFMSFFLASLFFGGFEFFGCFSSVFLFIKSCLVLHLFLAIRATLPRYRYDQLLDLGWRILFPCSIFLFLFYASLGIIFF